MSDNVLSFYDGAVTIDPDVCNGKPTLRGQRITVQSILEFLSAGDSVETILENYPFLRSEDIQIALRFASEMMGRKYTLKKTAA